jgi:hypothetical protein
MTERQSMTRLGTVRGAGRAAREHAGRQAPGWPAVILRVAGSGLLIATGAIHLDLYLTGYRTIPTIGWLFLLQVIAAFGLGLAVLAIPSRFAIAICATCPVRGHCLTLSLRHWDIGQHGVWGGLIAADRALLRHRAPAGRTAGRGLSVVGGYDT